MNTLRIDFRAVKIWNERNQRTRMIYNLETKNPDGSFRPIGRHRRKIPCSCPECWSPETTK